jgi:hypothetical protein
MAGFLTVLGALWMRRGTVVLIAVDPADLDLSEPTYPGSAFSASGPATSNPEMS